MGTKRLIMLCVALALVALPLSLFAQEYDDEELGIGESGVTEDELAEAEAAEEVDAPTKDARGVETYWGTEDLNEVEKGFFMNTRIGFLMYLSGLSDNADAGMMFGGGLGYDVVDKLLSIELDALASFHAADVVDGATGFPDPEAQVSGDFAALRVPLVLNFKYFTTKRLELYASVLGGLFYNDKSIDGYDAVTGEEKSGTTMDYYAGGRVGLEYYTGLRHFSIGFDVEVDYIIQAGSLALTASPMLKYTF